MCHVACHAPVRRRDSACGFAATRHVGWAEVCFLAYPTCRPPFCLVQRLVYLW